MLTQNSGDIHKARSNHWFFAYLPDSMAVRLGGGGAMPQGNGSVIQSTEPNWKYYGVYLAFLGAASFLALYTQIAIVHPVHTAWQEESIEAFGFQHLMARSQHEEMARKFHAKATFDAIRGINAHIKAAHGIHESQTDRRNATEMYELAKIAWEESKEEKHDAEEHGELAEEEHKFYMQYLADASEREQRAQKLEAEAETLTNQSEYYLKLSDKFNAMLQEDMSLEANATSKAQLEGELADNITQAEEHKEDTSWYCRLPGARHLCKTFGGMTALGEADALRKQEAKDYAKSLGLEQQARIEKTEAMISLTKASRAEEEARLDELKADQSHNESLQEEVKASEEHALELEDLQKELEDMKLEQKHLHDAEYYQGLEVNLANRSKKEIEYAHGEWKLGNEEFHESHVDSERSSNELDIAAREKARQAELVEQIHKLGRQLRLFSSIAAAYAIVAIAFFVMAVVTTNTVSLTHQLRTFIVAITVTISHGWNPLSRSTWEGQSILGDYQNRNCLRQLSCWYHHSLIFLFVVGMHAGQLQPIFELDSFLLRGALVWRFALTASVFETLLFQAIPHAAVLPGLTREFFRNIAIKFISSAFRFAIQMLLFLILCGEGSTWFFGWIEFLNRTIILWAILLIGSCLAHMWYIEFPYAWELGRNNGTFSDMTLTTFCDDITDSCITSDSRSIYFTSRSSTSQLLAEEGGKKATFAILPDNNITHETESLLTVSRAEAPISVGASSDSVPYSSIQLSTASSGTVGNHATLFPSAALQHLYEVSIQEEFYGILAYVELVLLVGVLLVVLASIANITHR